MLQIWRAGFCPKSPNPCFEPGQPDEAAPESAAMQLSLLLTHSRGSIWDIKWIPNSSQCKNTRSSFSGGTPDVVEHFRLGVVVLTFSDSSIAAYSIPHPESLSSITDGTEPQSIQLPGSSGPSFVIDLDLLPSLSFHNSAQSVPFRLAIQPVPCPSSSPPENPSSSLPQEYIIDDGFMDGSSSCYELPVSHPFLSGSPHNSSLQPVAVWQSHAKDSLVCSVDINIYPRIYLQNPFGRSPHGTQSSEFSQAGLSIVPDVLFVTAGHDGWVRVWRRRNTKVPIVSAHVSTLPLAGAWFCPGRQNLVIVSCSRGLVLVDFSGGIKYGGITPNVFSPVPSAVTFRDSQHLSMATRSPKREHPTPESAQPKTPSEPSESGLSMDWSAVSVSRLFSFPRDATSFQLAPFIWDCQPVSSVRSITLVTTCNDGRTLILSVDRAQLDRAPVKVLQSLCFLPGEHGQSSEVNTSTSQTSDVAAPSEQEKMMVVDTRPWLESQKLSAAAESQKRNLKLRYGSAETIRNIAMASASSQMSEMDKTDEDNDISSRLHIQGKFPLLNDSSGAPIPSLSTIFIASIPRS